jgi:hypothetical protein
MSRREFNRLDLLLKEIDDLYVQENFRRLKLFLDTNGVLDPGTGGGDTNINITNEGLWEEYRRTLPPSSTTIVDTFAMSSFQACEYIVNYEDTTSNKKRGLKLSVIKDDGSLKETVYSIRGSAISLTLFTNINGSDYELKVTNNEAFTVDMYFARLKIT